MWALYGVSFQDYNSCEILALFSTEQLANEYIRKSKLDGSGSRYSPFLRQFRQNSLLHNYSDAWVEEYIEPTYVIDPEI